MTTGIPTRNEWLAQRKIGASDAPIVLGISPFKKVFELWGEKTGLIDPPDLSANEAVEFGCRLERPIEEAYAARTGRIVAIWPQFEIMTHPDYPFMTCTPDALQRASSIRPDEGLLQIKTTSAWNASDWSDGPPLYYAVQCQHEMAVTGYHWSTLVVLIGGQRLRYYDLERNDAFIAAMIPHLAEFWRLVETRTPPPVDGSPATAKALARLHPDDDGQTVKLPPDADEWARRLEIAKDAKKHAEAEELECSNQLRAAIGDATFGVTPGGVRFQWKTQTRASYVVKESKCRVLKRVK